MSKKRVFSNHTTLCRRRVRNRVFPLAFLCLVVDTPLFAADPGFQSKAERFVERAEKFATEQAEKDVQSETEIELEGIVINRTRTPVGRRFYQEFSADWIENLDRQTGRANLLIEERPARGSGSLLTISDEQDVLYSQFLTPRIVGIKESAEEAAEFVRQQLINKAIARLSESQPGGDLFGEGY